MEPSLGSSQILEYKAEVDSMQCPMLCKVERAAKNLKNSERAMARLLVSMLATLQFPTAGEIPAQPTFEMLLELYPDQPALLRRHGRSSRRRARGDSGEARVLNRFLEENP